MITLLSITTFLFAGLYIAARKRANKHQRQSHINQRAFETSLKSNVDLIRQLAALRRENRELRERSSHAGSWVALPRKGERE